MERETCGKNSKGGNDFFDDNYYYDFNFDDNQYDDYYYVDFYCDVFYCEADCWPLSPISQRTPLIVLEAIMKFCEKKYSARRCACQLTNIRMHLIGIPDMMLLFIIMHLASALVHILNAIFTMHPAFPCIFI